MSSLAASRSAIHVRISLGCLFDVMSNSDGRAHRRHLTAAWFLNHRPLGAILFAQTFANLDRSQPPHSIDEKTKAQSRHSVVLTEPHKPTTLMSVQLPRATLTMTMQELLAPGRFVDRDAVTWSICAIAELSPMFHLKQSRPIFGSPIQAS